MKRTLLLVLLLCVAGASAVRADEQAEALVKQVQDKARKSIPLAVEYTLTVSEGGEKIVSKQKVVLHSGDGMSIGAQTGTSKPTGKLHLSDVGFGADNTIFDPLLSRIGSGIHDPAYSPSSMRCLEKETLNGITYDVIEMRFDISQWQTVREKWYIGPDKRVYRMTGIDLIKLLPHRAGPKTRTLLLEGVVTAYRTPTRATRRPSDAIPLRTIEAHRPAEGPETPRQIRMAACWRRRAKIIRSGSGTCARA